MIRRDAGPLRLTVMPRHIDGPILALRAFVGPFRLHWYMSRHAVRVSIDRR